MMERGRIAQPEFWRWYIEAGGATGVAGSHGDKESGVHQVGEDVVEDGIRALGGPRRSRTQRPVHTV